jgi:hypothetical protein
LADIYLFGSELVVWTAHEFKTALEAFLDFQQLIDANPTLSRRVQHITKSNGDEGIEFVGGQRLVFRARTNKAGRGLTGDRVILDEAQHITPHMMGSLMPTMSARSMTGNPQMLYGGSAGFPESGTWRSLRDTGRAGGAPSTTWIEWCAPLTPCEDERCSHLYGTDGCALDRVDLWGMANPAMGRRISVEWIQGERTTMTPEEFARERMGWWEEPKGATAGLPLPLWKGSTTPEPGTTLAWAVDTTPDFSYASIARASTSPQGVTVDLVEHRRGTKWVAAALAKLRDDEPVALDLGSPASALAESLDAAGIEHVNPSAREVAQACSSLLSGLVSHTVWHVPAPKLDKAVEGAARRPLGEAWAWSRKTSAVDISPLVAATLALWASSTAVALPDVAGYIW